MPAKSSHCWRRAASIAARVAQQRDPPAAAQAGAFSSIQHTQQSTNLQAWNDDWASIFPKSGGPGYRRAEEAVEQQQAGALQPRAREEQLQNSSTVGPAARVRAVSGRTGRADLLLSRIQGQQKNSFRLPAPPPLWPPQLTQSGIAESPQQLQQNVSNSKDHAITDTTPGAAGTSGVLGLDSITTKFANLAAAEASKISATAARISEEASKSSAADNAGSPIADEAGGGYVFGTEHVLHGTVPVPGMSANPPSQPVLSLSSKSIGAPPAAADDPEIRPAAAAAEALAMRLIAATAKDFIIRPAAAAAHASTCVPTDSARTSLEFAPLPMPAAHADGITSSSFPSETVITPALTFASIELVRSDPLELPAPVSTPAEPHPMPPPESTLTSSSPAVDLPQADSLRLDDSTLSNSTPPAWAESALPAVRLTLSSVDLERPSPQNAITAAQPMLEVTHLSEKTATAYSVSQVIRKSLAASYTAALHATPAATLATTPVATPATSSPTPVATLTATTAAAAAAASPATQAAAAAATSSPTQAAAAAAATQAAAAADRSITAFTAFKVLKENAEPGSERGLPTTDPGVLHVMHSQTLTQEVAAESTTHATPSHASASHTHEAALTEADAQLTTGNTTVPMLSLHGKHLRARAAVPLSRSPKQLSMPQGLTAPPSSKLAAIDWSPLLRKAAPPAGSALPAGPAVPQAPVGAALKTSDLVGGHTASAAVPAAPSPAAPSPAASAAMGMAASSAFSAPRTMDPATPVLSSHSIHHPKTAAPALATVTAAAQPPPRLQLHSCDMMQQHDTLLQALQALHAPQAQAGGTIDRPSPTQQPASATPAFSANALTSAAAALSPNAAQRSSPAVGLAALLSHRQAVPVGRLLPQDVAHPTPAELTHTPATIPQAAEPGCRVTQCTTDAARSFLERFSLSYTQKQEGQRTPNQPTPAALAAEQAPLVTASSSSMQTLLTQQPPAATTIPGVATGVASATAAVTTAAGPCARMLLGRLKDLAKSLVQPASWPEVEGRRERDTRVAGLREAKPLVLRQESSVDLMQSLDREAKRARGCKDAPVSAISSRWASKMQTLQQQKVPAARGALAAAASKAVFSKVGKEALEAKAEEQTAVTIPAGVSVEQLASLLGVQIAPLEAFLLSLGDSIKSEHDSVCADSAELAALEFGKLAICLKPEPVVQHPRNPVVTIMGHVDHGKTSLLDALRKTSVAASEAGGITQHVGAFEVQLPASQSSITFLDTPGHAAFTAMRARGAAVTDIVVLVVAADDGIMPQTRESIAHAHAADCPIVVAITKCDLPQAKVDHVKQQLAGAGLELEEYGGHVQVVQTCALTGQGLLELEEAILLQAELMELKAASSVPAEAVVVEASLDKRLGALATVIVKQGEMQVGDCIVVGTEYGKVRAIKDCKGGKLQRAAPGQPCQIIGIKGLPLAGDQLMVVASEERGRKISEARAERADDFRRSQLAQRQVAAQEKARAMLRAATAAKKKLKSTMQGMWAGRKQLSAEERRLLEDGSLDTQTKLQRLGLQDEGVGEEEAAAELGRLCEPVSLLVKVDVQGSLEAVQTALQQLDTPQAPLKLVYSGVGLLTESDVDLATSTGASILTFNLPAIRGNVEAAIKQRGVKLMNHRVIYHLLDDVQRLLQGASAIQEEEVVVGTAEVLATFPLTKAGRKEVGRIAGCRVKDGSIDVKAFCFRLVREGTTVWEGSATSIKRDRQEVDSVGRNTECGVVLEGGRFSEFRVGDTLLCVKKQVARAAAGSK